MGSPVMTLWVVQTANVAGEEARQVLDEIDFSILKILGLKQLKMQMAKII